MGEVNQGFVIPVVDYAGTLRHGPSPLPEESFLSESCHLSA